MNWNRIKLAVPLLALAAVTPLAAACGGPPPTWHTQYAPVQADLRQLQHDLATGNVGDLETAGGNLAGDADWAQQQGPYPHGRAATFYLAGLGYYANAGNEVSPGWDWDPYEVAAARKDIALGNAQIRLMWSSM